MGTRADFYVGRGETAEWLGSIAWDGYPGSTDLRHVLIQVTERGFREAVNKLAERDDFTAPEVGWPWPWDNSQTTDYSYAFEEGAVHASSFGSEWWRASTEEPEHDTLKEDVAVFPNMSERKNVTLGKRSGLIVLGGN